MKKYKIFVPTYGRAVPDITKMLDKDKDLHLTFCIRSEVPDSFYDKIKEKYKNRISFLKLGFGITDLGETRKRILMYASSRVQNCIMLDDGITNIKHLSKRSLSISEVIDEAVDFFEEYKKSNENVFCYTFFRTGNKFSGVDKDDVYFVGFPLQAFIIDMKLAMQHGINFKSMLNVGLEDTAFFADFVKNGLISISNQKIVIDGKQPNVFMQGGSHDDSDIEAFVKKRDEQHLLLQQYVGNMYGFYLTKKYRESLGHLLTYAKFDFAFFREVLVNRREENKEIIEKKFMIRM